MFFSKGDFMVTLGIESSCDETSVALLDDQRILASKVYSQLEHAAYGGVVPEVASRAHLEKIDHLADDVLREASLTVGHIGLIAVTDSPGLAGALLIGIGFALGLHVRYGISVCGINHLEGHICAIFLEHPDLSFPFLALVVSGGHTAMYRVDDVGIYTCLGRTVDDAAGEAFDKAGTMLGFPYPAGRTIEEEARLAGSAAGPDFPIARISGARSNFSFSGLKTSLKYYLQGLDADHVRANRPAICKAFQDAVVNSLVNNCAEAATTTGINRIALVGGVACNGRLREEMRQRLGSQVYFPRSSLCTDNGVMIACAGSTVSSETCCARHTWILAELFRGTCSVPGIARGTINGQNPCNPQHRVHTGIRPFFISVRNFLNFSPFQIS